VAGVLIFILAVVVLAILGLVAYKVVHPGDARRQEVKVIRRQLDNTIKSRNEWMDRAVYTDRVIYRIERTVRDNPTNDIVGEELRRKLNEIIDQHRESLINIEETDK
jgi:hypothetical protein